MLPVIALLQKFSNKQVCLVTRVGLHHTGMAFLRKEVTVWFREGQGSANMA